MSSLEFDINSGRVCPYCGLRSELIDSAEVYHGRSYGLMYICRPCNAYVGCHKGTYRALGRLANAELRQAKNQAHEAFDKLWKSKAMNRHQAYRWLSESLGVDPNFCHIGMFDVEQCQKVVTESKRYMEQLWKHSR